MTRPGVVRVPAVTAPLVRILVVLCPDWPAVAAGAEAAIPATEATVVIADNTVLACSPVARATGVVPGMRRREAQARCPDLLVLPADPARDTRFFEPVVAAVESVIPAVEVLRPGLCAAPAAGAGRYFGGDRPLAARIEEAVTAALADPAVRSLPAYRVGVADGAFAAALAARRGEIVAPGGTPAFLAPHAVEVLDRPELADLFRRLGLRTLGDVARVPAADVLARFGPAGAHVHRLARGESERLLDARRPPPELSVQTVLDPPALRVDTAAFAARGLAERLHDLLDRHGLACTRLTIGAQTEHGEELTRCWRYDGPLTAAAISDRVRWQLDGWLSGTAAAPGGRPTSGVTLLRLVPEDVVPRGVRQLGLWGRTGDDSGRVARALARVQGLLGPDAVVTAVPGGGRAPADQIRLVPWGEPREPDGTSAAPWPGRIPAPAPATVLSRPVEAALLDVDGAPVGVTGRYAVTAAPALLSVGGRPGVEVTAWAGPWPAEERWWEPAGRRRARFQVAAADGGAWLLVLEGGRWWVEAIYD